MKFKKPKLVPDAKKGWTWRSVQAASLNTAILSTWVAMPDDMKVAIPEKWVLVTAIVVGFSGIIGRFIDQGAGDA
ncbi:hypothetical protein [Pusillimonas minor]|uniref:Holin n=1 Tax=Pusillimonas minor TaxID=2697024 RepID=A0A842HLA3_9BURK|nr:hypothetical protein [Pusillimonas minor]MBC2768552.1 hypothetical protein [Pusillimonas minor]